MVHFLFYMTRTVCTKTILGYMKSSFHCSIQPHLLPAGIKAEQADEAADLQQEIDKNSQASKQRERPHCRHVGKSS